jgi:hypothetical protein
VHTAIVAWAHHGLLHGLSVNAPWWAPFERGTRDLMDSLDAVIELERDARVGRLAEALRSHPAFNVQRRQGAVKSAEVVYVVIPRFRR